MKLYLTKYTGGGELRYSWQGTKSEASAKRRELREEDCGAIFTEAVDVPVDKSGLLTWLNTNVTTDNG